VVRKDQSKLPGWRGSVTLSEGAITEWRGAEEKNPRVTSEGTEKNNEPRPH